MTTKPGSPSRWKDHARRVNSIHKLQRLATLICLMMAVAATGILAISAFSFLPRPEDDPASSLSNAAGIAPGGMFSRSTGSFRTPEEQIRPIRYLALSLALLKELPFILIIGTFAGACLCSISLILRMNDYEVLGTGTWNSATLVAAVLTVICLLHDIFKGGYSSGVAFHLLLLCGVLCDRTQWRFAALLGSLLAFTLFPAWLDTKADRSYFRHAGLAEGLSGGMPAP